MEELVHDANRTRQKNTNYTILRQKIVGKVCGKDDGRQNVDYNLNVRDRNPLTGVASCLSPTNKPPLEEGMIPKSTSKKKLSILTNIAGFIKNRKNQIHIS